MLVPLTIQPRIKLLLLLLLLPLLLSLQLLVGAKGANEICANQGEQVHI